MELLGYKSRNGTLVKDYAQLATTYIDVINLCS